jgi:hypothetical protein
VNSNDKRIEENEAIKASIYLNITDIAIKICEYMIKNSIEFETRESNKIK